jgi:toxin ParE1/3/4
VKVLITSEARAGIMSIGRYIAQDNPQRAFSFMAELEDACNRIGFAPRLYALVPRWRHSGVRKKTFGNYVIFHVASENRFDVVHILHGPRDYHAILAKEWDT